jgi:hypothetical protein
VRHFLSEIQEELASVESPGWLAVLIAFAVCSACLLLPASPAAAHRPASAAESDQMWQAVSSKYGSSGCVESRGQISTAHTPKRKYGLVTIADNICGNGQVVLAQPRHEPSAPWEVLGSGSDWGYPGRCASDLRTIPRSVLQDFFSPNICPPPMHKCDSPLLYAPQNGGYSLILVFMRARGVAAGDPMPRGWHCHLLTSPGSWTSCRYGQSARRFKFVFDRSAS